MKEEFPKIMPMGERAILLEFEPEISEIVLQKVLSVREELENYLVEEKVEVTNTYNSLLISYTSTIEDVYTEVSGLRKLLDRTKIVKNRKSRIFYLPVCYDEEFGLDLELVSRKKKLPVSEIIQLHTLPIYTVYFIGFLPGFLYLGGLDERLQISRKNEPRLKVEKGAVGIGEKQTGIYPKTSPGGWQIIGNCPVPVFDRNHFPPCEILAGDKLKFYAVSKEEFEAISEEISTGNFMIKNEIYEG
ncbi:MAG: 5-oxoprolinase subunit PxpB [Salegentibacter sp.]